MMARVDEGWTVSMVAAAAGVSERTVHKWLRRFREEGDAGLEDRGCRPRRFRQPVPEGRIRKIVELRRHHLTGWQIAKRLGMPPSTVAVVLKRVGLARLSLLEPPKPPPVRYERKRPGELVHFDVKPLGKVDGIGHRITGDRRQRARGVGYEFVHVAIDDASRLAYVEVLEDQKGLTAVGFLARARKWYRSRGIRIERIMTDNGSAYVSRKFRHALDHHGIRQIRTRPYRPETNGKAERFIQTMLLGWAYKRPYRTSNRRTKALPKWLRFYNERRPHRGLGMISPTQRLRLAA
jgi:transposase InsO family protein